VNYFKGRLFYCDFSSAPSDRTVDITDKQDCLDNGGAWVNQDSNFDNSGSAMLTLFIASTTEGWLDIMYSAVDAVGIDKEP
jgi:hypothetical protein